MYIYYDGKFEHAGGLSSTFFTNEIPIHSLPKTVIVEGASDPIIFKNNFILAEKETISFLLPYSVVRAMTPVGKDVRPDSHLSINWSNVMLIITFQSATFNKEIKTKTKLLREDIDAQ